MLTCEWMGRLGNNMFQIAVTYALAKKFKDKPEFNPHPNFPWLPIRTRPIKNTFVSPEGINEVYDIKHKPDMTIVGFFQRHEYFDHLKDELIKLFRVPKDWQPNTVGIHVRRGDFLFDPINFPSVSVEYILKALEIVGSDKKIVFCSDDINWCRLNFSCLPNASFRENTYDLSDIYFMANCDSVIMSNSTFSFWGAYLSNRERKIVFPLHWFNINSGRTGYEICPTNWIGI